MKSIFTILVAIFLLFSPFNNAVADDFESAIESGKSYYRQQNLDKAQEEFKKAVSLQPSSADAHYFLGYVLSEKYRNSHKEASTKHLMAQMSTGESSTEQSVQELEKEYIRYGLKPNLLEQSLKEFKIVTELDPSRYMAWYFIAVDHLNNKRYDMAIEYYTNALKAKPDHIISLSGLGSAYSSTGKTDLAIQYYEKSIGLDPEISMTHLDLAKIYLEQGQKEKSIEIHNEMKRQNSILYDSLTYLIDQY